MIEIKNVVKKIDNETILDNVSLEIPKGTAFGILGSNGAGKSSLLRLLCGIYQQESGEILIDGESVFNNNRIKEKIFFINDETIQFTSYTLNGMKNFYKRFYPKFSVELFEKLREKVNLPLNKKMSKFSKGMKRQAVVITALACCTDYIFLDEAFDGLDPSMRIIVKRMIVDAMIDRELTTIISSHNLREIGEICDSAALMHKGKIIFSSGIDEIQSNIHKIQVVFGGEKEYSRENFSELDIMHIEHTGSIYSIVSRGSEESIRKVLASYNPLLVEIIPLTLEEIFIYEMEEHGYGYKED